MARDAAAQEADVLAFLFACMAETARERGVSFEGWESECRQRLSESSPRWWIRSPAFDEHASVDDPQPPMDLVDNLVIALTMQKRRYLHEPPRAFEEVMPAALANAERKARDMYGGDQIRVLRESKQDKARRLQRAVPIGRSKGLSTEQVFEREGFTPSTGYRLLGLRLRLKD